MSSTVIASPVPRAGSSRAGQAKAASYARSRRLERSSGKGRRRRAAAEQRRIDHQRWGQYSGDDHEGNSMVMPSSSNRRNRWRRAQRLHTREDSDDFHAGEVEDEFESAQPRSSDEVELDVALAMSLSLVGSGATVHSQATVVGRSPSQLIMTDMTYENLVLLEDVRVVATTGLVSSLAVRAFTAAEEQDAVESISDNFCCICQQKYKIEEQLMILPCTHSLHHACGSEWLLKYSRQCPVCKCDITI